MKVSELIYQLKKFPQNMECCISRSIPKVDQYLEYENSRDITLVLSSNQESKEKYLLLL